jgi:hypothetical protein
MKFRITLYLAFIIIINISCKKSFNSIHEDKVLSDRKTIDSLTLAYFYNVIQSQKIIKSSDSQMLSVTDSLFRDDKRKQSFYFLVFTKSMRESDGFYSEALSSKSFEYVTSRTDEFVRNICLNQDLDEIDLANWAEYVFSEIRISYEGQESEEINKIENLLLNNIEIENIGNTKNVYSLIKELKSTAHNNMYAL